MSIRKKWREIENWAARLPKLPNAIVTAFGHGVAVLVVGFASYLLAAFFAAAGQNQQAAQIVTAGCASVAGFYLWREAVQWFKGREEWPIGRGLDVAVPVIVALIWNTILQGWL